MTRSATKAALDAVERRRTIEARERQEMVRHGYALAMRLSQSTVQLEDEERAAADYFVDQYLAMQGLRGGIA